MREIGFSSEEIERIPDRLIEAVILVMRRAEARDEEGQGTHEVRPDEAAHREAKTA